MAEQAADEWPSGQSVGQAIRFAAQFLDAVSDSARLDAEILMAHALGVSRTEVILRMMQQQEPEEFAAFVMRRKLYEPVAYITGEQEFYGLPFAVSPAVLIPRGDSETLVEAALAAKPEACRILDCGTGSGALLLAVLSQLPQASGVGIDRSPEALAQAQQNAETLGLAQRCQMQVADWEAPQWQAKLGGPFDLILTNPPYVEEAADLTPHVRDYEPSGALFAGQEGLDAYQILIPQLPRLLAQDGAALVEIGYRQAEAVGAIARSCGFSVRVHRDLADRDRALELQIM